MGTRRNTATTPSAVSNVQVHTPPTSAGYHRKPQRSASIVKVTILPTTKAAQPTKLCTQANTKLRTKEENYQTPSSPKTTVTPIPSTNQTPSPIKLTTPSNSYAQAVQGTQNTPNSHRDPPQNSAPTSPNTDNVSRLEKLIEKQSEQINNLLSLLTFIMDKLIRPDTK